MLPKIEKLRIIAKSTDAAIIGISESKLDESVLEPEIPIDAYKIFWCDRNRNDSKSYNMFVFPREIESVFEILLPNSKPITVGTFYRPPSRSNF